MMNSIINKISVKVFILFISIISITTVYSQEDPYEIDKYEFVNYKLNKLIIYDTLAYDQLFDKFTQIGFQGKNKVSIVHIGDSHLQADFLSGNFRRRLQTFFLGSMGGRGFVFPYKVAKTNNPINYRVSSEGNWESCRNVEKNRYCDLGLSGISVTTRDTNARISITIDDPKLAGYDFDQLMIFHEFGEQVYSPFIENVAPRKVTPNEELGYTLFEFNENISSVSLRLRRIDSLQKEFKLFGFNFDSGDPGIIYHTIGVNGAQFESYLGCKYFTPHLTALNPDWVIISLGTNDTYTNVFDSVKFKNDVEALIASVKKAAPKSAILLTTPGDHKIKSVVINANVELASEILKSISQKEGVSYWDFYSIMGGKGSVDYWRYYLMAHTDYLHFTQKGYVYQSQLLFNAFLRAYDNYLTQHFLLKK
ncbi:MAG: GDSL-type esterase/lipase family protein [Salinivirgaceae bacterium]|jgi:hypothetical protein|nr:GDSL-type esterase/lipase family protein [Salinivirgaceae bacterium]